MQSLPIRHSFCQRDSIVAKPVNVRYKQRTLESCAHRIWPQKREKESTERSTNLCLRSRCLLLARRSIFPELCAGFPQNPRGTDAVVENHCHSMRFLWQITNGQASREYSVRLLGNPKYHRRIADHPQRCGSVDIGTSTEIMPLHSRPGLSGVSAELSTIRVR